MQRTVNQRQVRQRFLIVCEGEKTEPGYFVHFRVPKLVVDVQGLGFNTVRLVQEAIRQRDAARRSGEPYDQVWCVFDRDVFPVAHFNAALDIARQNNIRAAYSNEAFELWYLLHFMYLNAAITRRDYIDRLGEYLEHPYRKNNPDIYDALLPRQAAAIKNAARLLAQYQPARPAVDNPSTTVHLLVQELNRFQQGGCRVS